MRAPYLLAPLLLLLCACGNHTRADYWLDGKERERKPDTFQPEIFISQRPARPYKDISLVRFESHDNQLKQTARLKEYCRARGGDAIVVGGGGDTKTSTDFFGGVGSQRYTNAVVIEYTDGK